MTTAAALREDLLEARFTVAALRDLWGAEADAALARGHRVPARRALAKRAEPLAVLARLFVLGDVVGSVGWRSPYRAPVSSASTSSA